MPHTRSTAAWPAVRFDALALAYDPARPALQVPDAQLLATARARRVRAVLQLGAVLVQLADVDRQGAHPQQHATPDEYRDQHPDRAPLVAAEQAHHRAGQAKYQVSHGMTPWAESVIGEPKPDPPNTPAIAPTGVTNENE